MVCDGRKIRDAATAYIKTIKRDVAGDAEKNTGAIWI
jgi:hypothetical protein